MSFPTMSLRHSTQDGETYRDVVLNNEYGLPDAFQEKDVILDIGANVGCFAVACLMRGAGCVWCYEPDPAARRILEINLRRFPAARSRVFPHAVWGPGVESLYLGHQKRSELTAMSHTLASAGMKVPAVSLDAILGSAPDFALIKLDCEGAEWPILHGTWNFFGTDWITGELHHRMILPQWGLDCTAEAVANRLAGLGFDFSTTPGRPPEMTSLFHARRIR